MCKTFRRCAPFRWASDCSGEGSKAPKARPEDIVFAHVPLKRSSRARGAYIATLCASQERFRVKGRVAFQRNAVRDEHDLLSVNVGEVPRSDLFHLGVAGGGITGVFRV